MRTTLRAARGRAVFVVAFACLLLGIAELRLLDLQILRARSPEQSAIYRSFGIEEDGRRGDLRDARGGVLATSTREVALRVWTSGIVATRSNDYPELLAQRLAALCGIDPAATRAKLERKDHWTLLATGIRDPGVIADLRQLSQQPGFRALTLETRYVREYPRGALLAPLLGWTGWMPSEHERDDPLFEPDGVTRGVAGLEELCDEALSPRRGRRLVLRDGLQREMIDPELAETPAEDGATVELTIEPLAQAIVEEAIDGAMSEFTPDWAQVVVLDPRTAEVAAIAQRPTPESPRPRIEPRAAPTTAAEKARAAAELKAVLARHQFLPAQRVYPPGSSFKPFMLGLALERGVATPDTTVDCEHGLAIFAAPGKTKGRPIRDTHPKGILTASEVLVESSNIGMTKLVLALVPEDARRGDPAFQPILDHIKNLGFDRRVTGLTGEEEGLLPTLAGMDRIYSLASLSFGQQMAVTGLQMAAACAAVANGGRWQAPRLVRRVIDDEGDEVDEGDEGGQGEPREPVEFTQPGPPPRNVFTPPTAAMLREMLRRVVDDGSTRRWKPAGWSMGGKTGTAQDEKDHSISITSYWCFAPLHDPRFLVLVVLHDPKRGRFAADNAAKVASHLIGRLLARFEVPRDRPEEVTSFGIDGRVVASRPVGGGG